MSSHNRRTHIDMRSCWALLLLGCSLWLATAAVAEVSEPRDVDPAGLAHGAGDGPPPAAPADSSGSSVVLPILGYSPDSGFLLGGMLLRFFQLDPPESPSRTSVFSPVLMYTTRNQILTFLGTELNWGQNRWQAGLVPGYMKMPDQFWGIGRGTRDQDEEDYTPELLRCEASLNRRVLGPLRGGVVMRVMRHRLVETSAGGLLESGRISGVGNHVIVASGLRVAFDSRDHAWSPTTGHWLQGGVDVASGSFGSDDDFTEYLLDLRTYCGVGEDGVVAAQVLATSCDGDVPFFGMPQLGGMEGLRGYRANRYLDRTRVLARLEWRSGEAWRRLGGVVFAGWGDVVPRPDLLTLDSGLWTVGAGLRITVNRQEQVKLRLDYGLGNGDSGFYLSLGEAF